MTLAFSCQGPDCQQLALPEFTAGGSHTEPRFYCSPYCAYERGESLSVVLRMRHAHQSGLSTFHACPWKYEQMELRGIKPRKTPGPLRRGTLVHYGYAAALLVQLENGDAIDAGCTAIEAAQAQWMADPIVAPFVTEEWKAGAEAQIEVCRSMFERSYRYLGVGTAWETLRLPDGKPAIELPIRIAPEELPYFGGFQGTVDWIGIDTRNGSRWVVDWKTRKSLQPLGYDERQRQAPVYQHLMKTHHGLDLRGTATYQIQAKAATEPHRLKRGGMSRDKRITTTWEVYEAAVRRAGLDPADYGDMRDHLLMKPMDRLDRYYRSLRMVRAVWDDTIATLDRIGTTRTFTRALDPMTCKGCPIRDYCEADQSGRDVDFLLSTEFLRGNEEPTPYDFTFDIESHG